MDVIQKRVRSGDVWKIGPHRLLCADASDSNALIRLFDGRQWDVMVTSPPYAQQRSYGLPDFDWFNMMAGVTTAVVGHAAPSFHALINLGLVHKHRRVVQYWNPWLEMCDGMGLPLYAWYVWDKLNGMPAFHHGRLAPCHEFIFHLARKPWPANKWVPKKQESIKRSSNGGANRHRDGQRKPWYSPHTSLQPNKVADGVIRLRPACKTSLRNKHHPAVFPVELPGYLLRSFARPRSIVLDPFAGSGTTIIAAHNTGHMCYAVEKNPSYCNLILAVAEQTLGCQAERVLPRGMV